jgi:ribonuclease D
MDRPLFRVMGDQSLVAIAQAVPGDREGLSSIGLTTRQIDLYGDQILQAVARGKEMAPISRPRIRRPDQLYLDRLKILSDWRKTAALKLGTESDIILPKNWMHLIAEKNPKNMGELVLLMPRSPWRLEQFGKEILKILARKNPADGKSQARTN